MRHRGGSTSIIIGKAMMQYGMAKNPIAPAPNSAAGTAMTV
jgi:hypothetical protein